jgi:hypothetical protein
VSLTDKAIAQRLNLSLKTVQNCVQRRLRYHPAFKNPQTEDEKAACEACKKYVWGEKD